MAARKEKRHESLEWLASGVHYGTFLMGRGGVCCCLRMSVAPRNGTNAMQVCERVAELYPKNYYAWTQRSWVVLRVVGGSFRSASAGAGAGADIGAAAERRPGSDGGAKVVAGGVSGENGTWSSPLADAEELVSLVVLSVCCRHTQLPPRPFVLVLPCLSSFRAAPWCVRRTLDYAKLELSRSHR